MRRRSDIRDGYYYDAKTWLADAFLSLSAIFVADKC